MEYSDIEAFLAIVQTRSLTKAAELLHLSQSTVIYRLKMLERELGATLVERGKGVPVIASLPLARASSGWPNGGIISSGKWISFSRAVPGPA